MCCEELLAQHYNINLAISPFLSPPGVTTYCPVADLSLKKFSYIKWT